MNNLLEKDIEGRIGTKKYYCEIKWRNGVFIMDEPEKLNGGDSGPDPMTGLLAALASCTLSTLRMYIDRKEWNIPEIKIAINMYQEQNPIKTVIKRKLRIEAEITDEQREKLILIATKCPISKILENEIVINTAL